MPKKKMNRYVVEYNLHRDKFCVVDTWTSAIVIACITLDEAHAHARGLNR